MTRDVVADLTNAGLKRVAAGASLAEYTSWRIGGPADFFGVADTVEALAAGIAVARRHDMPWIVLGGGSNVLVADDGVEGLVILNRLRGLRIDGSTWDAPEVVADAGVFFARVALFTAKQGYTGLEWGVAIPGTVGAGVVNNAGAHHGDVERTLVAADAIDANGNLTQLRPDDLRYRYRGSALKTPIVRSTELVVTRARFRITSGERTRALRTIDELIRQRSETQPISQPSGGSTFKNPPDGHAGALIEEAGLKGHRVGGAEVSRRHANFIVNAGGARASDVAGLINYTRAVVQQQFGVRLETEIQFVGRWPDHAIGAVARIAEGRSL